MSNYRSEYYNREEEHLDIRSQVMLQSLLMALSHNMDHHPEEA